MYDWYAHRGFLDAAWDIFLPLRGMLCGGCTDRFGEVMPCWEPGLDVIEYERLVCSGHSLGGATIYIVGLFIRYYLYCHEVMLFGDQRPDECFVNDTVVVGSDGDGAWTSMGCGRISLVDMRQKMPFGPWRCGTFNDGNSGLDTGVYGVNQRPVHQLRSYRSCAAYGFGAPPAMSHAMWKYSDYCTRGISNDMDPIPWLQSMHIVDGFARKATEGIHSTVQQVLSVPRAVSRWASSWGKKLKANGDGEAAGSVPVGDASTAGQETKEDGEGAAKVGAGANGVVSGKVESRIITEDLGPLAMFLGGGSGKAPMWPSALAVEQDSPWTPHDASTPSEPSSAHGVVGKMMSSLRWLTSGSVQKEGVEEGSDDGAERTVSWLEAVNEAVPDGDDDTHDDDNDDDDDDDVNDDVNDGGDDSGNGNDDYGGNGDDACDAGAKDASGGGDGPSTLVGSSVTVELDSNSVDERVYGFRVDDIFKHVDSLNTHSVDVKRGGSG